MYHDTLFIHDTYNIFPSFIHFNMYFTQQVYVSNKTARLQKI